MPNQLNFPEPVILNTPVFNSSDLVERPDRVSIEDLNLITTYDTNTNDWLPLTNKGLLNESGGGSYSNIRAILQVSGIVYIGGEKIRKTADLLFGNFNNIVSYNTSEILSITSNSDIMTSLGLYGQSVKVFYYNHNWSIMI